MRALIGFCLLFMVLLGIGCGGNSPTEIKSSNVDSIKQLKASQDSSLKEVNKGVSLQRIRDRANMNYVGKIGNYIFYCSAKGKVERSDTSGNNRELLCDLKVHYLVDKVYILPMKEDVFIITWQETAYTGLNTYTVKYRSGSDKPDWTINYKAPDPGVPVLANGHVYLSTLGIISKVNVENGETVWIHDSLYETTSMRYKRFDVPQIYKTTVLFFDFPIQGRKGKRDSLWVNDQTGRFVR